MIFSSLYFRTSNMKKSNPIVVLLLLAIIGVGFTMYSISYSQEFRDDCNLVLQDDNSLKEDYGFFLKDDIKKAFEQMRWNCPPNIPDQKTLTSPYLFDHLVAIGKMKLEWSAHTIWLTDDPSWLALQKLREDAKKSANDQTIKTLPSTFRAQYDTIRDMTGSSSVVNWFYNWSTGLYQKYVQLCDIARGIYLNESIVRVKQWTTSYKVDSSYNQCKKSISEQSIKNVINKQQALEITTFTTVMQKIQESINIYSDSELKTILETTQGLTNNMSDVTKKIDQPMRNCNPTDS